MSTIEKDGKENNNNRRMSGIEEKPTVAASIKTPSKSTRYSLGSASKYYFKYMNSSTKKKQKKNTSLVQEDNPNFYLDYMNSGTKKSTGAFNEDDTGNLSLLSIPELAGKNNNTNNSSLDTSVLSLASSSSEESDLLNKTTSSDTTELTASNFVLAATSRAKVRELSLDDSVWTKKETTKSATKQSKPVTEQPPSSRKPLGDRQSSANGNNTKATLSQDSTGTAAATPGSRRLSMRGASPSLRSRISASPKSLRKFTEDLKNSRIQRQMQREMDAKKSAAAKSALLNSSVTSALDSSLLLDGSDLSATKKKSSRASMVPRIGGTGDMKETSMMSNDSGDTTEDILGAMDEIFGMANGDVDTETLSQKPKRSSVTATPSAVNEALAQEELTEESMAHAVSFQRNRRSDVMEQPLQLDKTEKARVSTKSTESPSNLEVAFSNVNETKSTPTKLAATPQRIENPRLLDSPARNTRSSKKRLSLSSRNDDSTSLGDLGDILRGASDDMSAKSSNQNDDNISHSPFEKIVNSQQSFGSGEKVEPPEETEIEAHGETASLEVVGDLLSQLTQESTGSNQDEATTYNNGEGAVQSPGVSVSHKNSRPQQSETKEVPTTAKLALTPQRMSQPRLLDSPARNTRSAQKRQTIAEDENSVADLGEILGTDSEKPIAAEQQTTQSPAISNMLTQRSIGSEEKSGMSDGEGGGDATETATLGDLGSLFGGLTQESPSTKDDKSSTENGNDKGAIQAPVVRPPNDIEADEGTTPNKLAPTPQRMEKTRLLDSPARNTRSSKKRQSYSSAGDAESVGDIQKKNHSGKPLAISDVLTQRSIGSEEKSAPSNGEDITVTASFADIGDIFGGLTQTSADSNSPMAPRQTYLRNGDSKEMESEKVQTEDANVEKLLMEDVGDEDETVPNRSRVDATSPKLAATPQRMENPRLLDSPARNTRSTKKQLSSRDGDEAESVASLGDDLDNGASESPLQDKLMSRSTFGSEEKSHVIDENDATETASIGDIGDILDETEKASTLPMTQDDSTGLTSPPRVDRSYEKDSYRNTRPTDSVDDFAGSVDTTSFNAASEEESRSTASFSSPNRDPGRTSQVKSKESTAKRATTPQGIVNARLLDSPARNTRSAKKEESLAIDADNHTASIADLSDIFGSSAKHASTDASMNQDQSSSPLESNDLSQQSFGSVEKADIQHVGNNTETASLGDIGDILSGLSQGSGDYSSPVTESSITPESPRQERNSSVEKIEDKTTLTDKSEDTESFTFSSSRRKATATPTKLPPTPQRVQNPRVLDSPARNTRSASKQKVDVENASKDTEENSDVHSAVFGSSTEKSDETSNEVAGKEKFSPIGRSVFSQRSFGSGEKSVTSTDENHRDDIETATIGDIGDIFGGLTERPAEEPSSAELHSKKTADGTTDSEETQLENDGKKADGQSSPQTTPPRSPEPGQPSSGLKLNSSLRKRRATPTKIAPTPERIPNPSLVNSPARNTRSSKRRHREGDDASSTTANSQLSMSSSLPSSESDGGNSTSSGRHQLTQQSFGPDLSNAEDDENDTRTAASMEEINSILFELAQQAPTEGSPIAELNPIVQKYGATQNVSQLAEGTEDFNRSHVSRALEEGLSQANNYNISMSSMEQETSRSISGSQSSHLNTEELPAQPAPTPENRRNARARYSMMSETSRDHSVDNGSQRQGTPGKILSTQKSPMRLQPNSHVKPTPTKIQPSPRRVLNPRSIHSPARNTRSARKAAELKNTGSEQQITEDNKRKMPPYDSEDLRSPMAKKFKPVGILSSKKRRAQKSDSAQRTISFGSPEAALYHVGSPSGNFTPLPRSRAKALFAIPSNNASTSSSDETVEETVGIESNMHILVDRITADNMQESPELSPIANDQDSSRIQNLDESGETNMDATEDSRVGNEQTVELEVGIDQLLANATEGVDEDNEHTVPLEGGMEQVVAIATHSAAKAPTSVLSLRNTNMEKSMDTRESSPADSSFDMADSRSIASMNAQTGKYTSEFKIAAIEAQKLDFSMQASQSESDDSMDVDEGNTVPLEVDMTSLLAAHGNQEKVQKIIDNSADTTVDEVQSPPPPPVATTRFSLNQDDSPETKEAVEDFLGRQGEDLAISRIETNESQMTSSQDFLNEPYTLTLEELCEIGDLKANDKEERPGGTSQDAVIQFNEMVEKKDSIAISRWNLFLQAVCGEVESQDQDLDGKAASEYDGILNEQPPHMRKLEAMLRSKEGTEVQANIRALVKASEDSVEAEWNDWLKNLLEAFSSEWLPALSNDLKKECSKLDTISELGVQASTKISAISDKKVHRARRKSLVRRKSLARTLGDEIKELEAQIAESTAALNDMKNKQSATDAKIDELQGIQALAREAKALRTDATPSQKAYMSLKGLHSWNPSSMNESNLAFEAVGHYVQTSNIITYNLEGSAIDTSVSHSDSTMGKSTSAIIEYLSACVDEHASAVRQKAVPSVNEIGTSMQSYMWQLGRLDHTVEELLSLKKRYKTTFVRKGSRFVFSVEFNNSSTTLLAEFDIDHHYPSLPLEVQLNLIKGDINLDRVRRGLRKSAKTGFGNLSRACGIISAFVA